MDEEILKSIDDEISKMGGLIIGDEDVEELPDIELPQISDIKPIKKKAGQTRERMLEVIEIKKTKGQERRETKAKKEETERIRKEKIEFEYQEALRLKEAIEKRKAENERNNNKPKIERDKEIKEIKEKKQIVKTASRDILKERYLEEAKKRVMMDLFT